MRLLIGNPLIPPPLSSTNMLSTSAVWMKFMVRELLHAITIPFSHHLPENSIFSHLSVCQFVPAYGQSPDPISAFIDKNVITGCCCNEIWKAKATAGYYHPIFPTVAWEFNFWPFFTICNCSWATPWSHLCFYWQNYWEASKNRFFNNRFGGIKNVFNRTYEYHLLDHRGLGQEEQQAWHPLFL